MPSLFHLEAQDGTRFSMEPVPVRPNWFRGNMTEQEAAQLLTDLTPLLVTDDLEELLDLGWQQPRTSLSASMAEIQHGSLATLLAKITPAAQVRYRQSINELGEGSIPIRKLELMQASIIKATEELDQTNIGKLAELALRLRVRRHIGGDYGQETVPIFLNLAGQAAMRLAERHSTGILVNPNQVIESYEAIMKLWNKPYLGIGGILDAIKTGSDEEHISSLGTEACPSNVSEFFEENLKGFGMDRRTGYTGCPFHNHFKHILDIVSDRE